MVVLPLERNGRNVFLACRHLPAVLVAAMIVAGCGPPAQRLDGLGFDELAAKIEDPDAAMRARAAAAMGGRRDPRAARVLLQATHDADAKVRDTANKALAGILRMPTLPVLADLAPVAVHLKTCEGQLLALIKDPRPQTRAAAAAALGRIGERWVIEALIRLAATDKDPGVQEAAVLAIVSLGGDPDDEIVPAVGRCLLERISRVDFHEIELKDVIQFLRDVVMLSMVVKWGALGPAGMDRAAKISLREVNQLVGVVMCRLLLACKSSKPLAFVCDPIPVFSTVDDLAETPLPRLRRAARRGYSQTGHANEKAWAKLDKTVPGRGFHDVPFCDVIRRLSEIAGVPLRVNPASLKKPEIDPAAPISVRIWPGGPRGSGYKGHIGNTVRDVLVAAIPAATVGGPDVELDYLIDDGVLYVDTPDNLDYCELEGGSGSVRVREGT